MKRYGLLAAVIMLLSTNSLVFALSLTLENQSNWEIHELYFSPTHENNWGPDQLGEEVIGSGEAYTLTQIGKGDYDVKIVDEDGDICQLAGVDFRSSEHFVINDQLLVGCEVAAAEEDDGEEE